jgi:hypothetical protein
MNDDYKKKKKKKNNNNNNNNNNTTAAEVLSKPLYLNSNHSSTTWLSVTA